MLITKPRIPIVQVILFGFWPSPIKVLIYRLKGYRIGKHVSISLGSVVSGEDVEIGDHVSIGFLTIVRGRKIRIDSHVQIGSTSFLDTPHIDIGEGTKINEQVFVGGLQFPDSRFVLGRNCQVMQMTFINPARSVIVGDDSGIGGYCLIFGHTSWLSQFEGYPVEFAPIEIGNSVSLAWRVFVLPGSKVGDGAVVGANSVVSKTIPPRCLAVGYPARVVSKAPHFPVDVSDEQRLTMFRNIVDEMIRFFNGSGLVCEREANRYRISRPRRRFFERSRGPWSLEVFEASSSEVEAAVDHLPPGTDVFLSLNEIPSDMRQRLESQSAMWIEVAKKEQSSESNDLGDEVSLFLKRYGVRTLRASAASPGTRPEPSAVTSETRTERTRS